MNLVHDNVNQIHVFGLQIYDCHEWRDTCNACGSHKSKSQKRELLVTIFVALVHVIMNQIHVFMNLIHVIVNWPGLRFRDFLFTFSGTDFFPCMSHP